jgi:hypothetical protein
MKQLVENLEYNDLARLVHNEVHIDEFKSKLGDDKDIIVVSFKISGKEPSLDLTNFLEKGFDCILDADVSSGEMNDGDYVVFIEIKRTPDAPQEIFDIIEAINNISGFDNDDWRIRYYHDREDHDLNVKVLRSLIPCTPHEYEQKFGRDEDESRDLDRMRAAARIPSKVKAPDNEHTRSIKSAAGLM